MEPAADLDRGEVVAREIGQRLREARITRDESLEAIAKTMLVKPAELEALEGGELDRLPGPGAERAAVAPALAPDRAPAPPPAPGRGRPRRGRRPRHGRLVRGPRP